MAPKVCRMNLPDFYKLSLPYLARKYSGKLMKDSGKPFAVIFNEFEKLGGHPIRVVVYKTYTNKSGREVQIEWNGVSIDVGGEVALPPVKFPDLIKPLKPVGLRWFFKYLENTTPHFKAQAELLLHMANEYEREYNTSGLAKDGSG